MRRTILAFAVALCASADLSGTRLMAATFPPRGLAPGSKYQVIFVTHDSIVGSYGTEAPYNAFANSQAAQSSSLPAALWHAVTSTVIDGINANVNAPSGGFPVYSTVGGRVATATSNLYISGPADPVEYDQFGNAASSPYVWTGSTYSGTAYIGATSLGGDSPYIGDDQKTDGWLNFGDGGPGAALPIYVLSSPITVPVPEPATLTMLGVGIATLGWARLARRRNR